MRKVRFLILMILSVLSLNSCLLATAAGAAGAGARARAGRRGAADGCVVHALRSRWRHEGVDGLRADHHGNHLLHSNS